MIAQFDVNTIWRKKFGQALHRHHPEMLLVAPRAIGARGDGHHGPDDVIVSLPPGWAGPISALAMPMLQRRVQSLAAKRGAQIDTAIFTSFHYLPVARNLHGRTRIIYYCSDDYRSYAGWNGASSAQSEAELCRMATLSIFVSAALRDRAIAEYGLDPAACIVAPNASEPRFSVAVDKPAALAKLTGPVFGVVGIFNERIDYDFLQCLAASAEIGSLALVGPILPNPEMADAIGRLSANPKVHWFGSQPHDEIHAWMAGVDVAVIPYAQSAFNYFCSPMRLWDHLAIGQPILATAACDQVARHPKVLVTGTGAVEIGAAIGIAIRTAATGRSPHLESWDDRVALIEPWLNR